MTKKKQPNVYDLSDFQDGRVYEFLRASGITQLKGFSWQSLTETSDLNHFRVNTASKETFDEMIGFIMKANSYKPFKHSMHALEWSKGISFLNFEIVFSQDGSWVLP